MSESAARLMFPSAKGELPELTERIASFYERVAEVGTDRLFRAPTPGPGAILLNSLDQLCLAGHPEVLEAQIESLRTHGHYALRSSFYLDPDSPQRRFEGTLASFVEMDAAILCQSGWDANVNLLQVIATPKTPVYIDRFAHASAYEGIQAAGAHPRVFRHNGLGSLARRIRNHGPGVIVVDSVYSVPGSVCPLAEISRLARQTGCTLVVDESHSIGLYGKHGQGLVASLGLTDEVDFLTFSLSKTLVSRGGAIVGPARAIEFCRYEARQHIFSGAIPTPHDVAGLEAVLKVVQREGWRRERLHRNAARLRPQVGVQGWEMEASATHIIPLVAGDDTDVLRLLQELEQRELYGSPFVPPATPARQGVVRLTVHCGMDEQECDRAAEICGEARKALFPRCRPS